MPAIPRVALYGNEALPLDVNLVHCERIPERSRRYGWEIKPHIHEAMLQILYLETCTGGEAQLDGQRWALKSSCLIVVPAQCVHAFSYASDTDGPVLTAAQRPLEALLDALAPNLRRQVLQPMVLLVDPEGRHAEALRPLFDAIARETRTTGLATGAAGMSLLTALVVHIARVGHDAPVDGTDPHSRKARTVERFRGLLDAHFHQRWQVERYAEALGISAGQLGRLCREVIGISTLDAINARVLQEAKRALVYSSLSIKQVAAELGFDDEAYFGRFFIKHVCSKPTEFREAQRDRIARHGVATTAEVLL